jgi:hypothetical protein
MPMTPLLKVFNNEFLTVLWIHDILVWIRIRIRGFMTLTNGSGFSIDIHDANKKLIKKKKVFLHITF